MGALSRPDLPDGPHRRLVDALHQLHHRAGWPSLRDLAREVGVSRTTVSAAFSEPRLPRWGLVELLVETLGGDPPAFHELWLAASGGDVVPQPAPTGAVPRQLPPDVPAFTGRDGDLAELDTWLLAETVDGARIAVLAGTAGVGKTAIALRWAHRSAGHFPDGQLYADLRGYAPDQPVPPEEVLGEFLRALGLDGAAVPLGLPERTARLRSMLAGRRLLLILDNARSEDQVRPLLPGAGAVLVTSRDALAGLVVRDGAVRVDVPLLAAAEGLGLLRTLIGPRVDAEPGAAADLGRRCAWLPLALRVTAEFAANRPRASLRELVVEFDAEPRLDVLTAGEDEHSAVRPVLSWSYRHLRADVAAAFRALGRHPGPDLDAAAVAALIDGEAATAARLLEALARNHLVQRLPGRRYGLHDLLWDYARELAVADPDAAAERRLVEYYLGTARWAAQAMTGVPTSVPRPTAGPAPPGNAALDWLDAERPVLFALVRQLPELAPELSAVLADFLDTRAHYSDGLALHGAAADWSVRHEDRLGEADASDRLGTVYRRVGRYAEAATAHERAAAAYRVFEDTARLGRALHNLGVVGWRSGRYREAREHLHEAVGLHRLAGDRSAEGGALYNLGIVYRRLGDYPAALDHHDQALTVLREIGDRAGEGRALNNSGVVYLRLGRYAEARAVLERALHIQRERRDRAGECVANVNLGLVAERLGELDVALAHLQFAHELGREIGYRVGIADALRGLGVLRSRSGEHAAAVEALRRALAMGREMGEADIETGALNELGAALLADPDVSADVVAEADVLHAAALDLARASGDRYEEARALAGRATAEDRAGHPGRARRHRAEARAVLSALGVAD